MKEFRLIQHNLIPLALILVNISLVHLIYAFSCSEAASGFIVMVCLAVLLSGTALKNKYLLLGGIAIYGVVFTWTLL